jgi:hypothetical protein
MQIGVHMIQYKVAKMEGPSSIHAAILAIILLLMIIQAVYLAKLK